MGILRTAPKMKTMNIFIAIFLISGCRCIHLNFYLVDSNAHDKREESLTQDKNYEKEERGYDYSSGNDYDACFGILCIGENTITASNRENTIPGFNRAAGNNMVRGCCSNSINVAG